MPLISEERLLRSKGVSVIVLGACLFEVLASARAIHEPATSLRDAVHIYGLLSSSVIFLVLAFRCKANLERLLFGSNSSALLLWTALAVQSHPALRLVFSLRCLMLLMWAISTIVAATIFLSGERSK